LGSAIVVGPNHDPNRLILAGHLLVHAHFAATVDRADATFLAIQDQPE
jgi:hypothetical protein